MAQPHRALIEEMTLPQNQSDRSRSSGRATGNECMESNEYSRELDSLLSNHSVLSFLQPHCVSPRLIRSAKGRVKPAPPHCYNATYPLIRRKVRRGKTGIRFTRTSSLRSGHPSVQKVVASSLLLHLDLIPFPILFWHKFLAESLSTRSFSLLYFALSAPRRGISRCMEIYRIDVVNGIKSYFGQRCFITASRPN
jgi:hypothetical protein